MRRRRAFSSLLVIVSFLVAGTTRAAPPFYPPVSPPAPITTIQRPTTPNAAANIYVRDFDHLAALTAEDQIVSRMAERLDTRRTVSTVLMWGSPAIFLLMFTLGATAAATENCDAYGCIKGTNETLLWTGAGAATAAFITGAIVRPRQSELLDLINTWNQRHADQPFTITQLSGSYYAF